MCDCPTTPVAGWKGWQTLPARQPMQPVGDWVDLSHPLSTDVPRVPSFPAPVFDLIRRMPDDPLNVTEMQMVVHIGTHIDSPRHFFLDGPAMEDIPLNRLCGRGIVWPVTLPNRARLIEPHHLAGLEGRLAPGDALVLDTGWHNRAGSDAYDNDHPALSLECADWLLAQRVRLVALDLPTPELPVRKRPVEFDFPIHKRLLQHGVLIVEHITNLAPLRGKTVELVCAALNIAGADGAPARIIARPIAASPEGAACQEHAQ